MSSHGPSYTNGRKTDEAVQRGNRVAYLHNWNTPTFFHPFTLIIYELFCSHFEYANAILRSIGLEHVAPGIPGTKQRVAAQNFHAFMDILL
jgi:hypothetical protein